MRRFKRAIWVLGAFALSFLIGFEVRLEPQTQGKQFKPFVLYEQELNFSGNNVVAKEVDYTIARRADGSSMKSFTVSDSPNGQEGKAVFIWDVSARQDMMLEPFTRSVMTQHRSAAEIADFVRSESCPDLIPSPNNGQPPTTMLGHNVIRVEEKWDTEEIVSWIAPDLDCYPLQKTVRPLDAKFNGDYQTTTVTKIEEGAPRNSLFTVPADYPELSPLQLEEEYSAKFPGHRFFGREGAENAERQYRQHQNR